jgi:hypothetical protein
MQGFCGVRSLGPLVKTRTFEITPEIVEDLLVSVAILHTLDILS